MSAGVAGAHRSDEPAWVGDVLDFWFGMPEDLWWRKDAGFDDRIRARFLALHESLLAGGGHGIASPRAALAAVIALDQFGRNMFRGDPRAYAADPVARKIALDAIDAGRDAGMAKDERLFLYMPLQHSEDVADQRRAVALVAALGDAELTHFAEAHCRIIERFGRFPHRNGILGRASTAEEEASLQEPMGRF
ncbi:MAG TPA: DUF924 family protein [Xanthomonadaceae bacterium]|nr:DUF924 family protein [Xanthomonadaceae bacterium]